MRQCATTLAAEMSPCEHELLLQRLSQSRAGGLHLEIGTAAGGTLCAMMQHFPEAQRPQFVVVDPMKYFPGQHEAVKRNLSQHGISPETVDFRVTTSAQALQQAAARGERFDFMLIDGCHRIQSVTTDLKWTRLLNVGGVVCLHDVTSAHQGVWLAVERFKKQHANYREVARSGSLLVLEKTSESLRPEVSLSDDLYAAVLHFPLKLQRRWERLRRAA